MRWTSRADQGRARAPHSGSQVQGPPWSVPGLWEEMRRPWEPAGGVPHPDQGPERPPGGEDFKPVPLQDSAAAGQNPVRGGAEKSGELGPGQKDCLSQNLGETKRVLLRKALESRGRERGARDHTLCPLSREPREGDPWRRGLAWGAGAPGAERA